MIHAISWVILFSLPALLRPDFSDFNEQKLRPVAELVKTLMMYMKIFWVAFFYVNAKFFIPRFIYRQRIWNYVAAVAGVFLLLFTIDSLLFHFLLPEIPYRFRNFLFFNLFPLIFMLVASTTYRLVIDKIESDRREKDRINENLKTELSLLRSQVSPHFMFNVLNNMVAMARKKSDDLEDALIKLSHLLRYMLYETAHTVTIAKELEYLEDYIDLQKIRFGSTVAITYQGNISNQHLMIEPMLLIPFVENAFKHGVVLVDHPEIIINLKHQGHALELQVKNKYNPAHQEVKDPTKGIGLENVERRLELLYPDRHQLRTTKDDLWYEVHLILQLQ